MADVCPLLERALKSRFSFSVMKATFFLAYIKFVAIPATSFVDDFRHVRALQAVLVRKVGFDAACVLKHVCSDKRVEFVYTGFQTFSDLIAVKT